MKPVSSFGVFCLTTFSKPVEDRAIYKAVRKYKFRSILEVGIGDGTRAENMIRVANKYAMTKGIRYTGVDLFDGRESHQPKLSLREMHKRLSALDAKTQLVPGDLFSALTRIANSHVRTDLILISAGQDESSLAGCWFYFPRMLHAGSQVMIQRQPGASFQVLSRLEIEKMANLNGTTGRSKAA